MNASGTQLSLSYSPLDGQLAEFLITVTNEPTALAIV